MATTLNSRSARIPVGPLWIQTFNVTTGAGAAADEYFTTGFIKVVAVLGDAVIGDTGGTSTSNYVKNAIGTAQAEDSTMGALAIETQAALTLDVTVLGE